MKNIDICSKCGETGNFQFTFDYSKAHRPVINILCNNCGELFPPALKLPKEEPKQETPEHNSKFIVFTYQDSEDWTQYSIPLDSFQKADEFAQQFRDKKISYLICKTVKQGYNGK